MIFFEDVKHSCYKWKSGKAENLDIAYGAGYGGLFCWLRRAVGLAKTVDEASGGAEERKMKIIRKKVLENLEISEIFRNFATKLQN